MTEKRDAIVVGGGVSGLTAAAYLARAKLSVILLEKNEKCGGLVNTFVKDGFLFDGGVRALESAGIILPMIRDLEISLETLPSPVSIGIEQNMIHVTSKESLMDYENLLKTTYPDSCAEIGKVIVFIKKIMKDMEVLYGVDNPLFKNFRSDRSYFIKSYIPLFIKFILTTRRISKLKIPVEKFLADMITNRSLVDIIGQHFFENTPTFFAMSYFYLYQDYFYPRGGVGKLVEALENKILTLGGEIKTGTEIIELSARDNRVIDAEGKSYQYGTLVWAADLKTLYRITGTEGLRRNNPAKSKHTGIPYPPNTELIQYLSYFSRLMHRRNILKQFHTAIYFIPRQNKDLVKHIAGNSGTCSRAGQILPGRNFSPGWISSASLIHTKYPSQRLKNPALPQMAKRA